MNTTRPTTSAHRPRNLWVAGVLAVLVIGAAAAFALLPRSKGSAEQVPLYAVKSGPLTISVTASGSIRNSDAVVLRNEVEGQATILFIVDEGTMAKAGDLLVELDSSKLQDNKVDQEIKVQSNNAAYINADEAVGITKKQGESEIKGAAVALELAILDLEKYLGVSVHQLLKTQATGGSGTLSLPELAQRLSEVDLSTLDLTGIGEGEEGEYSQELREADKKITLLKEERTRAYTKHQGSLKLREKQYISQTELDADELELKRKDLELNVATKQLELLKRYTKRRTVAELLSEVDKRSFALLKARHEAESNLRDAQANLTAKELAYKREREKLDKLINQIHKCKLYAPEDGMVVYGTKRSRYDEPLKAGMQVYERQELIRMPKPGGMVAEVKVHESMVEKIREGLPAVISFDALGDKHFRGRVRRVAVVPDEEDRWLNPDAKSYKTEIAISSEDGAMLKPGMSCTAEIVIHQYEQASYVPVQAVLRVDGEPTVYTLGKNGRPEPRVVKVGLDNNRMICIVDGLSPGEQVLLNPPMPPAARPQASPIATAIAQSGTGAGPVASDSPAVQAAPPATGGTPAPTAASGAEGRRGGGSATAGQREQMRERFLAALPEEHREKVKAMSPEEQRAWFQSEEGQQVMQQVAAQFGGAGAGRRGPAGAPADQDGASVPAAGAGS